MGPPVCGARRCWARSGKVHVRSRWNHFLLPPPGPPPPPAPPPPLGRAAPRRASMGPEPRRWAPLCPGGCGVGTGAESREPGLRSGEPGLRAGTGAAGDSAGRGVRWPGCSPPPAPPPRRGGGQRVPLRRLLRGVLSPSLRPGYGTGGLGREGTRGGGEVGTVSGHTRPPPRGGPSRSRARCWAGGCAAIRSRRYLKCVRRVKDFSKHLPCCRERK